MRGPRGAGRAKASANWARRYNATARRLLSSGHAVDPRGVLVVGWTRSKQLVRCEGGFVLERLAPTDAIAEVHPRLFLRPCVLDERDDVGNAKRITAQI